MSPYTCKHTYTIHTCTWKKEHQINWRNDPSSLKLSTDRDLDILSWLSIKWQGDDANAHGKTRNTHFTQGLSKSLDGHSNRHKYSHVRIQTQKTNTMKLNLKLEGYRHEVTNQHLKWPTEESPKIAVVSLALPHPSVQPWNFAGCIFSWKQTCLQTYPVMGLCCCRIHPVSQWMCFEDSLCF